MTPSDCDGYIGYLGGGGGEIFHIGDTDVILSCQIIYSSKLCYGHGGGLDLG
jgi:hypothetical protein